MTSARQADVAALKSEVAGLMNDLSTALGAEFGAIRAHDVDALEAVIAQKAAIVSALEAAGRRIGQLPAAERAGAFADLGTLARECQTANRINGGAIELNRNLVERLLDTVRGTPRTLALYDANGRVQRRQSGRQMGRA